MHFAIQFILFGFIIWLLLVLRHLPFFLRHWVNLLYEKKNGV